MELQQPGGSCFFLLILINSAGQQKIRDSLKLLVYLLQKTPTQCQQMGCVIFCTIFSSFFAAPISLFMTEFQFASQIYESIIFLMLIIHHTNKSSFKQIILSIKVQTFFNLKVMQLIQEIDAKLAQTIPYYSKVSSFTTQQYKASQETINKLFESSTNKLKKMTKVSSQFKKDLVWIISQTAEDFLDYIQDKLDVECTQADEKNKTKRALNIFYQLKNKKLTIYVHQFINYNKDLLNRTKLYGEKLVVPIFVSFKATLLVSKQMLMEMISERLGQLKMTYKCHKDTITMFFSGEFKQEKVVQKIKQSLGSLKQLTVNFVQKGLEIKISKKDVTENYHNIMTMLSQIFNGVSQKSIEQWTSTKSKTFDLYNSVLDRIKAKQNQIRIKMIKERPAQNVEFAEQKDLTNQNLTAPTKN